VNQTVLLAVFAFTTLPCLAADEVAELLHFKASGFSIAPLEEAAESATYLVLTMTLPASDGFAPNVNVQVQAFDGTLDEYVDLSKRQFTAQKIQIVSEKRAAESHTFELAGEIQGQKLHFYSKAEMGRGKVYLTTGTSKESQWKAVGEKLRKCVDSFKRD